MDPVRMAILAAAVPAAVAAAAYLLTRWAAGRREEGTVAVPALALGWAGGYAGVAGVPRGLPVEAWQWLLPAAGAALAAGLVESRPGTGAFLRWGLRVPLAAALAWLSLVGGDRTVPLAAGIAAGLLLLLGFLDGAGRRGGGPFLSSVALASGGAAVALGYSGTMTLALLAGSLAAAAGTCFVFHFPVTAAPKGAAPLAGLLLGGLLLDGVLFAELPVASALLVAASPAGMLLPGPRAWAAGFHRRLTFLRGAAVAILAGAGAVVAILASPPMDI